MRESLDLVVQSFEFVPKRLCVCIFGYWYLFCFSALLHSTPTPHPYRPISLCFFFISDSFEAGFHGFKEWRLVKWRTGRVFRRSFMGFRSRRRRRRWSSVFSIGDRTRTLHETTAVGIRPPTLMSTTVRPKKHDKSFLARWAPVAQALSLSRYQRLSLSLSSARIHEHRALFFPRLSTDHTIRLLSCYRPIARRVNGGMRDNCATLQNAFGAISIYSSIENIYTCNSFSRSSRFMRASISSLPRLDLTNVLIRFVGLGKCS